MDILAKMQILASNDSFLLENSTSLELSKFINFIGNTFCTKLCYVQHWLISPTSLNTVDKYITCMYSEQMDITKTRQICCLFYRAYSRLAPSQWETSLQSNTISYWLGANLESALLYLSGEVKLWAKCKQALDDNDHNLYSLCGPLWALTLGGSKEHVLA